MKTTKKILILITLASFSVLTAGESVYESNDNLKQEGSSSTTETTTSKNKEVTNGLTKDNSHKLSKKNICHHRKNLRKDLILNSIKLSYVKKVNQIEQCILLSENLDDLEICNQRVHNLSKNINKIKNRFNKSNKKRKKFNKNY